MSTSSSSTRRAPRTHREADDTKKPKKQRGDGTPAAPRTDAGGGLLAGSAVLVLLVSITFSRPLSDDFWFIDDAINYKSHGGYAPERCSDASAWAWVWTHKPVRNHLPTSFPHVQPPLVVERRSHH